MEPSLNELLAGIEANAALPVDRAMSMAPAAYNSVELSDLEQERVFRRGWVCVGRTSSVSEPGSWLRAEVGGELVMVTRSEDGQLRALSRVCRHRSMDLLAEAPARSGSAKRFTCPYHAWTYRLDGSLAGAPEMQRAAGFDPASCRLPQFRLHIWQGFVFVNLDPAAPELAEWLAPMAEHLGDFDLSDYVTTQEFHTDELDGNWKSAFENSIEGYHNLGTHRTTLLPGFPVSEMEIDGTRTCVWGWAGIRNAPAPVPSAVGEVKASGTRLRDETDPLLPGLPDRLHSAAFVAGVFPSFFLNINPTSVVAIWFQPAGPLRHRQTIVLLTPASVAEVRDEATQKLRAAAASTVVAEDFAAIEAVGRGLRAPSAVSGPLSHHEALLWRFQQYLADQLTGASSAT